MNKKAVIALHVFIWLFTALANLPFLSSGSPGQIQHMPIYLVACLYLMACFYFFYFVMIPVFLKKKRLFLFFLVSLLTLLILPLIGYTLLFTVKAIEEGYFDLFKFYSLRMHVSAMIPLAFSAISGSFFRLIIDWFEIMNIKEVTEKQKLISEMSLMKSNVNPHFLFNTLNNIDALIHQDTAEASKALVKLSEIMRYMTYETTSDFVSIESEINYIRNLVELYKLRLSNPDQIKLSFEGDFSQIRIAPVIFVPFIENAFKHGVLKNGVIISLKENNGVITFESTNTINKTVKVQKDTGGTGLSNIRKRLDLIYPGSHHLSIDDTDHTFHVKLTIDTHAH